ncbi:MAG: thioredoxin family protein [Pirellulaceae bacterium]|nr:thioredoxin family protein [Pirellulaceae bacterium]
MRGVTGWLMSALVVLVGISGCGKSEPQATSQNLLPDEMPVWLESYDDAQAASARTGKPILANFTGSDWCSWCIRLHKEVFSTAEFKKWSDKNVVLLELDFPRRKELSAELAQQNQQLAQKFKIQGYPTIVFINSAGEQIATYGYDQGGPEVWTQRADELLGIYPTATPSATN